MNNAKINTLEKTGIELTENDLEKVNGGSLRELAVAGAVVGAAAIGTAAVVGTAAIVGTAAVIGTAAIAAACRPRPAEYENAYSRETGYRW